MKELEGFTKRTGEYVEKLELKLECDELISCLSEVDAWNADIQAQTRALENESLVLLKGK